MALIPYVQLINGNTNTEYYGTAVPSSAGDGNFVVGDRVIITTPATGQPYIYVCTVAGTGASATFKSISLS